MEEVWGWRVVGGRSGDDGEMGGMSGWGCGGCGVVREGGAGGIGGQNVGKRRRGGNWGGQSGGVI